MKDDLSMPKSKTVRELRQDFEQGYIDQLPTRKRYFQSKSSWDHIQLHHSGKVIGKSSSFLHCFFVIFGSYTFKEFLRISLLNLNDCMYCLCQIITASQINTIK